MITTIERDELIKLGVRHRAAYLGQPAGFTLGIASAAGEALAALLPEGYLDATEAARQRLETLSKDRTLTTEESKELTRAQDEQLRRAKVWRRKVIHRANRMTRMGARVPANLTQIGRASAVPAVTAQLTTMAATFEANLASMGGEPARALLDEGNSILA